MNPRHHYVTQSSVYTNQYCGPLTDKAIEKWQKKGYYGPYKEVVVAKPKKHVKAKVKVKSLKTKLMESLLGD